MELLGELNELIQVGSQKSAWHIVTALLILVISSLVRYKENQEKVPLVLISAVSMTADSTEDQKYLEKYGLSIECIQAFSDHYPFSDIVWQIFDLNLGTT